MKRPGTAEAPVVKLLQSIFEDAIKIKASDIHIEPKKSITNSAACGWRIAGTYLKCGYCAGIGATIKANGEVKYYRASDSTRWTLLALKWMTKLWTCV